MRRAASTPLRRGMPISRTAISGLSLVDFSTASRPSTASAQTCQPSAGFEESAETGTNNGSDHLRSGFEGGPSKAS